MTADSHITYEEVCGFLLDAVRDGRADPDSITLASPLIGQGAVLSSLELVHLLLEAEDFCGDRGVTFDWASDSAMSARRSPYRTVESLARYIASIASNEETP
ncbi:MAG: hypothetical protein LBR22_01145 [Desulfovibrio sp.]|jgi:hypothetical protein|nr:hypothetical protein [Desulfovibrio sp.]